MALYTKRNDSGFHDALIREAEGLRLLRDTIPGAMPRVPDVYGVDQYQLTMTRIAAARWTEIAWQKLGAGLAALHQVRQPRFGYACDNYIGLNPQKNTLTGDWGRFFVEYRLGFQVSLIQDDAIRDRFGDILQSRGERLADYLGTHCAHPSLVHGDLWSGNVLCDPQGTPWLIDPAAHFADPEVDLAMTELFGGFHRSFYLAYRQVQPLSVHYQAKKAIYNLYHYLNHYNLFGDGYLDGCRRGFDIVLGL